MKKRRRELNVFSMSFLDAITAGFGCVVLLFMLVSENAVLDSRTVVDDLEAEARRWELRVLTGQRNLVQIRERLEAQIREWTALLAMRENVVERDQGDRDRARDADAGLRRAASGDRAVARRARRAAKESEKFRSRGEPDEDGTRLRTFQGEGNRQYLTGLRMGGKHVVMLVDTSTSMLDRTIVNILRRRNMSPAQQTPRAEVAAGREYRRLAHDADRARHESAGHRLQRQGDVADSGHRGQVGHGRRRQRARRARRSVARELPARSDEPARGVQRDQDARTRSPTTSTC